jgi:hypothetical protein
MNKINECIILGGGLSVNEGQEKGLFQKIENKFVIGINFAFKFFNPTFTCFADPISFYKTYYNEIKDLPLIVGRTTPDIGVKPHPNTIFLKPSTIYNRNLSNGVYHPFLGGLIALSLAIYLLDVGKIYLLGFDGGKITKDREQVDITKVKNKGVIISQGGKYWRERTHWYQGKLEHRGIGKYMFYHDSNKVNKLFEVFKGEIKCSILNVSPASNLTIFPKISYNSMLSQMDNNNYPQNELRNYIREKLKIIQYESKKS